MSEKLHNRKSDLAQSIGSYILTCQNTVAKLLLFTLIIPLWLGIMAFDEKAFADAAASDQGLSTVSMSDIDDSYSVNEIQALVQEGVISGYEDGTYQPRKPITR